MEGLWKMDYEKFNPKSFWVPKKRYFAYPIAENIEIVKQELPQSSEPVDCTNKD